MKLLVILLVLVGVLCGFTVASASADAGSSPQAQYRTFTCDNGNTYTGGFVGFAAANFFIVGTTDTFAIKVFTEFLPSGPKTFYTGIQGYPGPLVTCSYTDPQGIFNVFSGFFTPIS
jgi:hypothetical protein